MNLTESQGQDTGMSLNEYTPYIQYIGMNLCESQGQDTGMCLNEYTP